MRRDTKRRNSSPPIRPAGGTFSAEVDVVSALMHLELDVLGFRDRWNNLTPERRDQLANTMRVFGISERNYIRFFYGHAWRGTFAIEDDDDLDTHFVPSASRGSSHD